MISLHRRRDGGFLTTIEADYSCSWVLNNKGKAVIYLSSADAKAIRMYMGQRNLISISSEKLPLWAGVLETDQTWDNAGGIEFTGWSAESLLAGRCPVNGLTKAPNPGALFRTLINLANAPEDTLIRAGEVSEAGGPAETTLDGTNLLDVIRDLAERWDMEWDVSPAIDNKGRLRFSANWYKRRENNRLNTAITLTEGFNIRAAQTPLQVQRRVVNDLTGFGDASTEGTRPNFRQIDDTSRSLYGLMQGVEDYDGVVTVGGVQDHVRARLAELRYPKNIIRIIALDVEDTFKNVRVGLRLPFRALKFGFLGDGRIGMDTRVRVLGMRYDAASNELEITNKEVT